MLAADVDGPGGGTITLVMSGGDRFSGGGGTVAGAVSSYRMTNGGSLLKRTCLDVRRRDVASSKPTVYERLGSTCVICPLRHRWFRNLALTV